MASSKRGCGVKRTAPDMPGNQAGLDDYEHSFGPRIPLQEILFSGTPDQVFLEIEERFQTFDELAEQLLINLVLMEEKYKSPDELKCAKDTCRTIFHVLEETMKNINALVDKYCAFSPEALAIHDFVPDAVPTIALPP